MSKVIAQYVARPDGTNLVLMSKSGATTKQRQSGFTLIEIAIVLVIIGLLLGGVLKGQALINTARVRALNNNVDGITSAWFSFSDRYRAFPGDYAQASVNLPGITASGDGNGNGLVDTGTERVMVWSDLQAAGYITGNYPNNGKTIPADDYSCPTTTCPDNGFGQGMVISYGALQHSAKITTPPAAKAHELISGRAIPSSVLAELDRKIDDGTPIAGSMQLGAAGTGWGSTEIPACLDSTGNNYNMKSPSDNCAAVFRNF